MRVVFLGPPGAGKGTMAAVLSREYGLAHISTGALLRTAVRQGDPVGLEAKKFMEQGVLVPDGLVIQLVIGRLRQPDAQQGFVLDGFPRTLSQAQALDEALTREGRPVGLAIDFETSQATIVRRLSGRLVCSACQAIYHRENRRPQRDEICDTCGGPVAQRPDDRPETITQRLEVYRRETAPLLRYYRGRHLLARANGDHDVTEGIVELKEIFQERGLVT